MIKKILLAIVLLIVLILCGTAVMKIFDLILVLGFENIWIEGIKVGFIAWILLISGNIIYRLRKYKKVY